MLKKIKIQIKGTYCRSCKVLIETEVDVLEGVKDINVDYKTGECEIEFDDEKVSKKKIFEVIEGLDYQVQEGLTDKKSPKKQGPKRLIIAGIFASIFWVVIGFLIAGKWEMSVIVLLASVVSGALVYLFDWFTNP